MGLFDGDNIDGLDDSDYVVDEEIDDDDEDHDLGSDNHISMQPHSEPKVDIVKPIQTTFSKVLPARLKAKGITHMVIKKSNGKEYIFS